MLVLEHILGRVQNSDDLKHVWHFEDLAWVFHLISKTMIIPRIEVIRLRSTTIKGNIVGVQKRTMQTLIKTLVVTFYNTDVIHFCRLRFRIKRTEIWLLKLAWIKHYCDFLSGMIVFGHNAF
jgi:hypothetical protein